jgi:pimeloyl-ACP methyl ester carboxylesterase
MFEEYRVRVATNPVVELLVADAAGPRERTVLVIHGGPDWDHSYLRDPLVQLAGSHRLLLPDLRGCGRSTRGLPADQYSWDLVVADLLALLDHAGVPRADVLGFSTGGLIAQRLALAAPKRVCRLIVASSSVLPVPDGAFAGWQERSRRKDEAARLAPDPAEVSGPELTRAWATASASMDVWRADRMAEYLHRLDAIQFSGDWAKVWLSGQLPSARPHHAAARLRQTEVPILLLHGRQDMTFPAELAEQAAAEIPAARVTVLDGAGHLAHIDRPAAWLAALAAFLD